MNKKRQTELYVYNIMPSKWKNKCVEKLETAQKEKIATCKN